MISFINFRSVSSLTSSGWVNMASSGGWQQQLKDQATDQVNGWIIDWDVPPDGSAQSLGPETAGVGDAGWVIAGALRDGHRPVADGVWARARISGLNDQMRYNIGAIGSTNSSGRTTRFRVSGAQVSDIVELSNYDAANSKANDSEIALFQEVQPFESEIYLEFSRTGSVAYINAAFIEEVESTDPTITITSTTPITPGSTVTGTYSNFNVVPTAASISDGTNSLTTAAGLTGFTVNDTDDAGVHSGTFSFVMPSLPTSGTRQMILFGQATVELT